MKKIIVFLTCFVFVISVSAQIKTIKNPKIDRPVFVGTHTSKTDAKKDTVSKSTRVFKTSQTFDKKRFTMTKAYKIPQNEGSGSTAREGANLESVSSVKINYLLGDEMIEKLNVFNEIFPDKNPKSNYYYYLPKQYTLKWDKYSGEYAFYIHYLSSENGELPKIMVNVELVSNIDKEDLKIAELFLKDKLKNNNIKLMPLPVIGVDTDLAKVLDIYNVKPENIIVSKFSDYLEPMNVQWTMENVDNLVSVMFKSKGLSTNVHFLLRDEELVKSVPLDIKINDPITFGKLEIKNTQELSNGWTNYLDYPVILTNLLGYKNQSKSLINHDLGGVTVMPGEIFKYAMPVNYDRLWFDYRIVACDECDDKVTKMITGGTSGSQITNIEIDLINLMATTEAYKIKLNIRSKQADPNGEKVIKLPAITITEDDQEIDDVKLYKPEEDELSYEYQLIQIMPDGKKFTSPWHTSNEDNLVIGSNQLETIFKEELIEDDKWKDGENLNSAVDSLVNKGKDLLKNLFNKKDKEEEEDKKED